jgi:hypothetical protein
MTDEVREIIDVYLVKCEKGVLALCGESDKKTYENLGKEKNLNVTIKKITTNTKRANQIGENIFKIKFPYNTISELMSFRNSIIRDFIKSCSTIKNADKAVVWSKISKKNNIECSSPDDFSQAILDKIEYVC